MFLFTSRTPFISTEPHALRCHVRTLAQNGGVICWFPSEISPLDVTKSYTLDFNAIWDFSYIVFVALPPAVLHTYISFPYNEILYQLWEKYIYIQVDKFLLTISYFQGTVWSLSTVYSLTHSTLSLSYSLLNTLSLPRLVCQPAVGQLPWYPHWCCYWPAV